MSYVNNAFDTNKETIAKLKAMFDDNNIEYEYCDNRLCTFKIFPGIRVYVGRNNTDVSVYMYGIHEDTFVNNNGVGNFEIDCTVTEVIRLKDLYDIVN